MTVSVQIDDFDVGAEIALLRRDPSVGAIVSFVGTVRDLNAGDTVASLTLEHYPGMTEKAMNGIVEQARARWTLQGVRVIHRVGTLHPGDQIVLVVVAGAHRGEAFAACEFIMDFLKTQAPFWKKESTPQGERWVEAHEGDESAAARWNQA